jgi:preprotein translocase subunit SecG
MQAIPDHTRLTAIAVVWNDFIAFSIFFQWLSKKKRKGKQDENIQWRNSSTG